MCRWCITELYDWPLHNFVNWYHPNKVNLKKERKEKGMVGEPQLDLCQLSERENSSLFSLHGPHFSYLSSPGWVLWVSQQTPYPSSVVLAIVQSFPPNCMEAALLSDTVRVKWKSGGLSSRCFSAWGAPRTVMGQLMDSWRTWAT